MKTYVIGIFFFSIVNKIYYNVLIIIIKQFYNKGGYFVTDIIISTSKLIEIRLVRPIKNTFILNSNLFE